MEDTYLDELFYLTEQINRRKIGEYKILTAIAQSPHMKNPRKIWEILKSIEDKIDGDEKFDLAGFEALKFAMGKSTGVKVVQ